MAKTISQLQDKNKTHIKIGTFYVRKKTLGIAIVLFLIAFVAIRVSAYKKQKEMEERILAQSKSLIYFDENEQEVISLEEQIQRQLREVYGMPPEGFKWDYMGNLVAIADIEDLSAEDILYTYVQSVHLLDFATAQRVASKSVIIERYNNYFDANKNAILDSKQMFERTLLKLLLTTLSIDGITDQAVKPDGTMIYTAKITCLDLTNKSFWEEDKQNLFDTLYIYDKTETDTTKKNQLIYDYVIEAYEKERCGYRTIYADFVITKTNSMGWLLSDDTAFAKQLMYDNGLRLDTYINQVYTDWLMEKIYETEEDRDIGFDTVYIEVDESTTDSAYEHSGGLSNREKERLEDKIFGNGSLQDMEVPSNGNNNSSNETNVEQQNTTEQPNPVDSSSEQKGQASQEQQETQNDLNNSDAHKESNIPGLGADQTIETSRG